MKVDAIFVALNMSFFILGAAAGLSQQAARMESEAQTARAKHRMQPICLHCDARAQAGAEADARSITRQDKMKATIRSLSV